MCVRSASCHLADRFQTVYLGHLIQAPWEIPDSRPPTDWPQDGHVTFHDYSTRYRPGLELVLENLACSIKAAEKVRLFYFSDF